MLLEIMDHTGKELLPQILSSNANPNPKGLTTSDLAPTMTNNSFSLNQVLAPIDPHALQYLH